MVAIFPSIYKSVSIDLIYSRIRAWVYIFQPKSLVKDTEPDKNL